VELARPKIPPTRYDSKVVSIDVLRWFDAMQAGKSSREGFLLPKPREQSAKLVMIISAYYRF
jgi:hypothetical protein